VGKDREKVKECVMRTNTKMLHEMNTRKIKRCIKALEWIYERYSEIKEYGESKKSIGVCRLCKACWRGERYYGCRISQCPWIIFEGHSCVEHRPQVLLKQCARSPEEHSAAIDFRLESIPKEIRGLKGELERRSKN